MTQTQTQTQTETQTQLTSFPAGYWDTSLEVYVELPKFFLHKWWEEVILPPLPDPNEIRDELATLLDMQADLDERKRRRRDIKREATGLTPQFQRVLVFGPASHPRTFLLVQAMLEVGRIVAVHYKFKFNRPRPSQIEPELRPMLDVPGHPSYPSGHAVQMHLIAQALATVVRNHDIGNELFKIAHEVAVNREWAGLHYRSDTKAGKQLAREIFPYVEEAYENTFRGAAQEWL